MPLITDLLHQSLLLEGGAAVKGVSKITQVEARAEIPKLLKLVSKALKLPAGKVTAIGSAGRKLDDEATSGDIDLAVEAPEGKVEGALVALAYEGKLRAMKNLHVYSFAHQLPSGKLVQVDLMPTHDVTHAEWAFQANQADLEQGLKGAQRNELFFAVAKHAHRKVLKADEAGEPLTIERYFYDLSRGLMLGTQTREGKKKVSKGMKTADKRVIASSPAKITKLLFGPGVTPQDVSTFAGTLAAIKSPSFPHAAKTKEILQMARDGIKNKGLKLPSF